MTKERRNFYNRLNRYLKRISKENDMPILSEQCGIEQHVVMALSTWVKTHNNSNIRKLKEISKELKEKFLGIKFSQVRSRNLYDCYGNVDYSCSLEVHIQLPY